MYANAQNEVCSQDDNTPVHSYATGDVMSMHDRKLRNTRRLIAGVTLAFVVSFATAAMVVFMPESPARNAQVVKESSIVAMSEYVQLHQARHTLVPNYMPIGVATVTR